MVDIENLSTLPLSY